MRSLRITYAVFGAGQVLLGLVHVLATARVFDQFSTRAMWFASGGIAIMMTGTFNLLRQRYGHSAPGLVRVAASANIVMIMFSITYGCLSRPSAASWALVLIPNVGATIFCFIAPAQLSAEKNAI